MLAFTSKESTKSHLYIRIASLYSRRSSSSTGSASVWRAAASLKSESKHVSLESGEGQAVRQEETAYGPGESRAYRHLYIRIGELLNLVATEGTGVEDLSDAMAACLVGTRKSFSHMASFVSNSQHVGEQYSVSNRSHSMCLRYRNLSMHLSPLILVAVEKSLLLH